jgi:very-short-patch-repair endonuclease
LLIAPQLFTQNRFDVGSAKPRSEEAVPWSGSWPEGELWRRLRPEARRMRKESTPAERRMWVLVRDGRIDGFKFRRQHGIEAYLADYYCADRALVIEVDGPIHASQREQDEYRQMILEILGLRVIRFSNYNVLNNSIRVREAIRTALHA